MTAYAVSAILGGVVILVIGTVTFTGNTKLVHDGRKIPVREEDMPAYAKAFGRGLFLLGGTLLLSGFVGLLGESPAVLITAFLIFVPGVILSLILIRSAQNKYRIRRP